MVTFSHLEVCDKFDRENPFATAYFSKTEKNASLFLSNSMQNRLYTFGLVLRGLDNAENGVKNLFDLSKAQANERLTELFQNQPTEGIECYDITVLEVTDGKFKNVKFGENKLETFHRAFVGTREECLADLKRQFEKAKDEWTMDEA